MAVKYLVVLNGKVLIAVARGNLIQELGEVADITLLVGFEVCGNKDDTLVRQSIAPFGRGLSMPTRFFVSSSRITTSLTLLPAQH